MEETIVFCPFAGRGHIVPIVDLAKSLLSHHPHFSITVIISIPPFETVSTSSYAESVSAANPSITFLPLPSISLPPDSPKDIPTMQFEFSRLNNPNLHKALITLSESSKIVKAIIIDFYNNPAFDVSTSLSIPTYYFRPSSASALTYLPFITPLQRA
ncbi:UDP-glucosyltransferase, putative [Ricinus communis]|uniref:UDP-glucosyltransferase, putative n=1 Tax=Ricinus communis TaxID=3988 RepID=B9RIR0_RICCO|nr:UDP-glucosyltransferase, putative [Ricinus communis]